MAKKLKVKQKAKKAAVSPVGRFLWSSIAQPVPATSQYDVGKYVVNVLIPKDDPKAEPVMKDLKKRILAVARDAYKNPTLKYSEVEHSIIKDGNDREQDYCHDCWLVTAKTQAQYPPNIFGPRKADGKMTIEEVAKIKDGDYGRIAFHVSSYSGASDGLTAYLSEVQFAQSGDPLGGGKSETLELIDDIVVDLSEEEEEEEDEDIEDDDLEDDEDEDEEEPAPKPSKKAKAKTKKKAKKKAKKSSEEDEDEDAFDESSLYNT